MRHQDRASQSLLPGMISVCCNDMGLIDCKRCSRVLKVDQIAFLTRTSPIEAFEAWCIDCSLTLSRWALVGAAALHEDEDDKPGVGIFFVS